MSEESFPPYKHPSGRSEFFLRLRENTDNSLNLYVSKKFTFVLDYFFDIGNRSHQGWQPNRRYEHLKEAWLRSGLPHNELDLIKQWAHFAICQTVWIKPSQIILEHFSGNELDFCLAADFNCTIDEDGNIGGRTDIGDAEYQLKYRLSNINAEERQRYCDVMDVAMQDIFKLLPLPESIRTVISPVPAMDSSQQKIAWVLATHMANKNSLPCLRPMLTGQKPQMKTLPVDQKIKIWEGLFSDGRVDSIKHEDVVGNTIVIVDDLYQSGASVWAYAKYLKGLGAQAVYGLVCVKSMRDTDNKC